jgi:hypothetical protein
MEPEEASTHTTRRLIGRRFDEIGTAITQRMGLQKLGAISLIVCAAACPNPKSHPPE